MAMEATGWQVVRRILHFGNYSYLSFAFSDVNVRCVREICCGKTCICLCASIFVNFTSKNRHSSQEDCRLSSQKDTERGQAEQRSFVQNECGHEKFGNSVVRETSKSCFQKAPLVGNHLRLGFRRHGWPHIAFDKVRDSIKHTHCVSQNINLKKSTESLYNDHSESIYIFGSSTEHQTKCQILMVCHNILIL